MVTENIIRLDKLNFSLIQRRILQFAIICLPLINFPIKFPLVAGNISLLFLFMGYGVLFLECIVRPIHLTKFEKYGLFFLLIYFGWYLITGFIGIEDYRYYHLLDIAKDDKLNSLYFNLNQYGNIDSLALTRVWLRFIVVRSDIHNLFFTYAITMWIYHLYCDNFDRAFCDIYGAIKVLCTLIGLYSVIEVGYLFGSYACKAILININPLFMEIAISHSWWPPLLWTSLQVRSLFAEPSFFGIFLAMALPLLANAFFDNKMKDKYANKFYLLLYVFMVMLLVMSKARTAIALFSGEILLIIFWQFVIYRTGWKCFFRFLSCTVFAICLGLFCTFHFHSIDDKVHVEKIDTVQSYVSQNVTSIVGNKRSNNVRMANTMALVRVGLNHPVFGVGQILVDEYVSDQFTDEDFNNSEVQLWTNALKEKGPLKGGGYPILNQFAGVLARQGILGLLIFVFPAGLIIKSMISSKRMINDFKYFSILVAFCGLVMAFFSNIAQLGYYILCGLLLCLISSKYNLKKRENDVK